VVPPGGPCDEAAGGLTMGLPPSPFAWRPNLPWEGPPIPRFFSRGDVGDQPDGPIPSPPDPGPSELATGRGGDYVVLMRPKGKDPTWLRPYQYLLRQANVKAAKETKDLKGPERVRRMNAIVGQEIKHPMGDEAGPEGEG